MKLKLFLHLLCSILLLQGTTSIHARAASVGTPQGTGTILAKVDLRVELMSIVARLAGYEEYSSNEFKQYVGDVNRHFEKYRQHPVIQFAAKVRQSNGISFDAVMSMAVHLSPPPALTPRVPFTAQAPDKRWGK